MKKAPKARVVEYLAELKAVSPKSAKRFLDKTVEQLREWKLFFELTDALRLARGHAPSCASM